MHQIQFQVKKYNYQRVERESDGDNFFNKKIDDEKRFQLRQREDKTFEGLVVMPNIINKHYFQEVNHFSNYYRINQIIRSGYTKLKLQILYQSGKYNKIEMSHTKLKQFEQSFNPQESKDRKNESWWDRAFRQREERCISEKGIYPELKFECPKCKQQALLLIKTHFSCLNYLLCCCCTTFTMFPCLGPIFLGVEKYKDRQYLCARCGTVLGQN